MRPFSDVETTLTTRFHGLIHQGSHNDRSQACLLECAHAAIGAAWSDCPDLWPDLRPLNDAAWSSDARRTAHLIPVLRAYWEWSIVPVARQHQIMARLILLTVQRIIAELPGLPEVTRAACRQARTLDAATAATAAADATVASSVADAARAAARAAADAVQVTGDVIRAIQWTVPSPEAVQTAETGHAQATTALARAASAASFVASHTTSHAADAVLGTACALWIEAAHTVPA